MYGGHDIYIKNHTYYLTNTLLHHALSPYCSFLFSSFLELSNKSYEKKTFFKTFSTKHLEVA